MTKKLIGIYSLVLAALLIALAPGATHAQARGEGTIKKGAEEITINFVDVEITSLAKIMSEITGKNFIYDSDIKGRVTIVAPTKLSSEEAFKLFVSALELKNFTVLQTDDAYKIIPLSMARQSEARLVEEKDGPRPGDAFIVRLIPLEYVSVQEALPFVQPFVSRNGYITAFGSRNALLVADTVANTKKIADILENLDTEPERDEPEIVYLDYASAETIAKLLREEVGRRQAQGKPRPGGAVPVESRIVPEPRLNAVVLSGPESEREHLKGFIELLDVMPPEATSRINLYYLENADAEKLSQVLGEMVSPDAKPGAQPTGLPAEITGEVNITPHPATNSLIILASPADYQSLLKIIEKLDRRPKQVFVEAMITEVSIDDALELGTRWRFAAEDGGEPVAIGGMGTIDTSALQTILSGLTGFSAGGAGNFLSIPVTRPDGTSFNLTAPGYAALFSVTEFEDVVNVLSTPHILTSDNTEAEIIVAENVPFLSKFERQAETTGQPLIQSIERKDVGIILRIKPKISEGGYVKLDIYQEISAIAPTQTAGASDLITTKRSAKTNVVVKDNQTVVIGGLIQDRVTNNETKVPLLGDLPLLGWLFKFKTHQKEKTNLLVFITPHVVDDFRGLEKIKERKEQEYREKSGAGGPQGAS